MTSEAAKLVALPTGDERESRPAIRRQRDRKRVTCRHRTLLVDEDRERVTCEDCNLEVGPMQALGILSRDFDYQQWAVDDLRKEHARLLKEVEELKREERNVKARLRRARKQEVTHD